MELGFNVNLELITFKSNKSFQTAHILYYYINFRYKINILIVFLTKTITWRANKTSIPLIITKDAIYSRIWDLSYEPMNVDALLPATNDV